MFIINQLASSIVNSWSRIFTALPAVAFFLLLILEAFLAEPTSFYRAWNQGRSALLAVVPLLMLEMGKRLFEPIKDRRNLSFAYIVLIMSGVYYFFVGQSIVRDRVIRWGVSLGIDPLIAGYSWVWALDYIMASLFLIILIYLTADLRVITPFIYTLGMSSFLFIDVLLPYNSLGPFQYVVPQILQFVVYLINSMGIGRAETYDNILALTTQSGSMNLQVFWPSAGLHGIAIGLLAVAAISVKLGTGLVRGAFYLLVAAFGSFAVNILRIAILAIYAMSDINNPEGFERFHSVAGELVFIPWIILYIFLIVRYETKTASIKQLQKIQVK
jgi:thaumarchaeosortase